MNRVIIGTGCALALAAGSIGYTSAPRESRSVAPVDAMLVVIRAEGPNFVLDTYYEGNRNTTKPIPPKELVPYLQREVPGQARVIDLTGKVHVLDW